MLTSKKLYHKRTYTICWLLKLYFAIDKTIYKSYTKEKVTELINLGKNPEKYIKNHENTTLDLRNEYILSQITGPFAKFDRFSRCLELCFLISAKNFA